MDSLSGFAIDVLIKATIVLGAAAIATRVMRRQSAALRHLVWTLAVAGAVALPVITALVPFRLRVVPGFASTHRAPARVDSVVAAPAQDAQPQADQQIADASPTVDGKAVDANVASGSDAGISLATGILFVWLAGVLVLLSRIVIGFGLVRRVARRAEPVRTEWNAIAERAARRFGVAPVQLRTTDEVAMPFACGLIVPVIVLPTSCDEWSAERRDAVLMHEVSHISRGDLPMNALSHVMRAIYWFHPLAWLAAYRLRVEGERACDDAVLRAGARASDYADHLLSIVRSVGGTVPNVALAMARRSDFEGRLLAILEPGVPRNALTRWRTGLVAAGFTLFVLPLAAMAPAKGSAATAAMSPTVREEMLQEQAAATPTAQSSELVKALMATLSDPNANVRLAAVSSLGKLKPADAIDALVKALREDSDARVREAAAWALGEIDDSRAVAPLLEALKSEKVAAVREKIIRALGEIDDPVAVGGISAALKDDNVAVRRAAVSALGELEDASATPALAGMVRDEDVEVRKSTAEALGQLKGAGAFEALVTLTKDNDAEVRSNALSSLGNLEDRRALPAMLAALKDSDAEVRSQAAEAIHNIEDLKTAPKALIDALTDPSHDVRKNAAEALGHIEDPAAVPALKTATSDSDVEVRRAAAEALSDIGGQEAITALMALLKDRDPEIRRIAAEALGNKRH